MYDGVELAVKEVRSVTGDCSDIDTEVGNCGGHDLSVASIGAINLYESTPVLEYSCLIHTVKDSIGSNELVFEAAYEVGVRSRCDA